MNVFADKSYLKKMKIKIFSKSFGILLIALIVMASTFAHVSNAIPYGKQEDSEYVKERIVKPYTGKTGWWVYIIKVCADKYNLGITEIVFSSDMETRYLGVNKVIVKDDCSAYGAVMKAKNGDTMGYKLTTTSEAVEKISASKHQKGSNTDWAEIDRYKFILGFH